MSMDRSSETSSKSKRPSDSAFKQQKLPAWQPILTAGTVLPTFFVIGIAFIPIGAGLLYFSNEVKEIVIDYTDCVKVTLEKNGTWTPDPQNRTCASEIDKVPRPECFCSILFELKEDFKANVYMYYGLSNYYQNHRRYVKSRDDNQLLGNLGEPSGDCIPFKDADDKKYIAPCGAIANSLFSDTLSLESYADGDVPLLRTGIAWPSDKKIKFKNPEVPKGSTLEDVFKAYEKPVNWSKPIWALDLEDPNNNGFQNEDLIVWMRTAALPSFRKLYRRIDHDKDKFKDGLKHGKYYLHVQYNYSVSAFEGKKSMILSTTSILGGKNPFLGIAYIVVGCICLLIGIALLFIHVKCSKSTNEMINVNPRTPYQ